MMETSALVTEPQPSCKQMLSENLAYEKGKVSKASIAAMDAHPTTSRPPYCPNYARIFDNKTMQAARCRLAVGCATRLPPRSLGLSLRRKLHLKRHQAFNKPCSGDFYLETVVFSLTRSSLGIVHR